MKLNGLTNNLKNGDQSLSNSYLSHIVELLRQETESLSQKEALLEEITKEHIETQKHIVDTETVNALNIKTDSITVNSINEKIFLSNVIDVLTTLKVNGKDVLTESVFQGPFTYKGVVDVLPETANAGDVYISNDSVNIYNGTTWDDFILPVGTISLAEYNEDKAEILSEIADVTSNVNNISNDLSTYKTDTDATIDTITLNITDLETLLETKVNEAPIDNKSYVRKNADWVEQSEASNTVKHTAGDSIINNTEDGVTIESPVVNINTPDIKVNGTQLTQADKFALTKTSEVENDYHYEMKFGRSPFDATSSIRQMFCGYGDNFNTMAKAAPEMFSVFTKNYQWVKWGSTATGDNNAMINITAMDKEGNINLIPNHFINWIESSSAYLQNTNFITFNQEFVPDGWDDTVYLFCTGSSATNEPYLVELKDGDFSRKIDIYNGTGKLKEQGYVPSLFAPSFSQHIGIVGGKGLRNKNIQRICMIAFNVADIGGNWAIIIGGDRNSNITDPFDPTKAIYLRLPTNAYYSYACMAATDSAWYLQEQATGRMMRITPDGQVSEINLTEGVLSCGYNYIEYTDKNNRPAAAYYVHRSESGGGHYVIFLEEDNDGQVNCIEKKVESDVFTPTAGQWYAQLFKFMENSHYIFFTADCGYSPLGEANYGNVAMKNMLWYWDKKTHTTHAISNFYEGITFEEHSFIEMHKTKDGAIWFPYIVQGLTANTRTGELHFISDIDYTDIDENNVDIGSIEVQSATVGTDHSFFTVSSDSSISFTYYTHNLQRDPSWAAACNRNQLSATNDDGILCIISGDAKSIALCYGDGNIKVYPISSKAGLFDCDADKEPYLPDESYVGNSWHAGSHTLYGMTHGWVLKIYPTASYGLYGNTAIQHASYTYIGVQYKNGEPTILIKPHLSKIPRCGACYNAQRIKWEKYAYLQTYDDYERRKLVLPEIRAYIPYAIGSTGNDGYFKEVRKEKHKLNLTYNNTVISSIDC